MNLLTCVTWGNFLGFLEIIKWPLLIGIFGFYFRKVITYLFFSFDEFSFFGLRGKLIPVQKMINDRVKQLREKEIEDQQFRKIQEQLTSALRDTIVASADNQILLIKKMADQYGKITEENRRLRQEISVLEYKSMRNYEKRKK